MNYTTKFDINQVVCFKDAEGGVMQGTIIGLIFVDGWSDEKTPSTYELRRHTGLPVSVSYTILVKAVTDGDRGLMRHVRENLVATTFEDAWKLG